MGHHNPAFSYTMNGHVLEETKEERDIGVIVSANMKPTAQCMRAAKTAQTVLGQLSRAFHYRDRHVFMRLYKQYVRPHLEFSTSGGQISTKHLKTSIRPFFARPVAYPKTLSFGGAIDPGTLFWGRTGNGR